MFRVIRQLIRNTKDPLHTREGDETPHNAEDSHIEDLYRTRPYMEAYCQHTNMRVAKDPHSAVGGMWEHIGKLQFNFLTDNGLTPDSSLLDIGCGTLRGGRFFIRCLNPNRYTGIDISPAAIEYAKRLVCDENLVGKRPRLLVSHDRDLRFRQFAGESFDFILAQSVFTHLRQEHIEECFEHIGHIMTHTSRFFFTYNEAGRLEQRTIKDFSQSFSFFVGLAAKHGFILEDLSHNYDHPRGQKMLKITRRPGR